MKYSYSKAKSKLKKKDKDELENYMNLWRSISSNQNVIYRNVRKEFYLREELFLDFFQLVLAKKEKNPILLKEFIFDYFKKYRLEGDLPIISGITNLGFVLTEYSLKQSLRNHYFDIFSHDESELDMFINDLRNNNFDRYFDFLVIKKFDDVLWVTFDYTSSNPFKFISFNSRKEIYTALALDKYYRDTPIMLFNMEISDEIEKRKRKATVFDANDYKYFRPPNFKEKNHGFTHPHRCGRVRISGKLYCYNRRPEIVCDSREIKYRHITETKGI